jgi:SAM-dependent methyltransferase
MHLMHLFNRSLHRHRRNKAAAGFRTVDFVVREAADRLADRLGDMQRDFPLALELGCHLGQLAEALAPINKIGNLIQADSALPMVSQAPSPRKLVCDEEFLPIAPHSLDAALSVLSLHWVNDLVGSLIQLRHALKPDGLLLAVVPGPRTLQELRQSFLAVAVATGKAAPRLSPFVEVRDAGAVLQRAGFALPVIESEILTFHYADPFTFLRELRQMGEANALIAQHKGLTTARFWQQIMAYYQEHFCDSRGRIAVTVELVFMTAWTPHASQQQPSPRGSGTVSLKDYFIPIIH